MNAPRIIPDAVRAQQIAASDPDTSAWVAANAGSGKTHVLAQRVVRLLLNGVDPAKILCITFTKAAAANMANRVFGMLADWTALDDKELDKRIEEITGRKPDATRRKRARRLFALALETPGGLKVQTIHAFCTRLLHQFPFEANVAARFSVLDDVANTQLLDQLTLGVLLDAAAAPEGPLGRALAQAITAGADQTFKDVVMDAIRQRDAVTKWIDHAGSVEAAIAQLSQSLGVDPTETSESLKAKFFDTTLIPAREWPAVAAALAEGTARDQEQVERIAAVHAAAESDRFDTYLQIFCTSPPELKKRKSLVTKAIQERHPQLFQRLMSEQERVCALLERRRAVAARDRTACLLTIAHAVLSRYRAEKDRRGLLDYDDLIDRTLGLFENASAAWVLYKLDLGIDHVLVDEAQDTSPKQWDIIRKIVAEFAAGAGAREIKRTVFAVGDDKQSIFSFQGAAPLQFAEMKTQFRTRFTGAEMGWSELRFESSFRSGAAVLGAVDDVFARPEVFAGLTADPVQTVHRSLPDTAPGSVEIWPLFKPDQAREIEGWDAPFDEVTETSPTVRLAAKIAKTINVWTRQGRKPGDVLILVRQRGPLFEAIIRALKDANIPVAGADRLVLIEHIAVMDLIVLADALLLPDDDLALATVLRSPLFGFSDEQLFRLAWNRGTSLRQVLAAKRGDDPMFAEAVARLDRLALAARGQTPFAFYARLLGAEGGRRQFLMRLGHEAADALDEFLNLALDYENRETPSLQGFAAWLRRAQAEVKRDMEMTRDEVRVMTVHGAKGLEAPIVILADTTTRPTGPRDPRLLALPVTKAPPDTPPRLVWAGRKTSDVGPMQEARERARRAAQDEYRRLLYVAMTRAEQRLIICGTEGVNKKPEGCWYDLTFDALSPLATEVPAEDGDGTVWRYQKSAPEEASVKEAEQVTETSAFKTPAWLMQDAPRDKPALMMISPSGAYESTPLPNPPPQGGREKRTDREKARARGNLVHRLMQSLPDPDIPRERRAEAAKRYLTRNAKDFTGEEREAIAAQVLAVLDDPRFAELFAPGSRAEAPVVGRLGGHLVSGQIDRLAITPEAVLIGDYKTDRPAPRRLDDVPQAYVTQLALYRAVLARLYPDRPIRAALIWTEIPDIMEIPSPALDAALASLPLL